MKVRIDKRPAGPDLIETTQQVEKLVNPIRFESEGEENIYFTDGNNHRYYMKDISCADREFLCQRFC